MCLLWGGRDGCSTTVLLSHDKLALMTVTAGNTVMAHNEPVQTNCRVHRYVGNMNTLILATSAAARRVPVHRPPGRQHPALLSPNIHLLQIRWDRGGLVTLVGLLLNSFRYTGRRSTP